jgi:hypothetical protein
VSQRSLAWDRSWPCWGTRDARAFLCTALERPTNQGKVVITHSAALGHQINGELLACDLLSNSVSLHRQVGNHHRGNSSSAAGSACF